ncbi:MAG: transposase [Chloroflexi bacterium]|nr:transposase [Chloroflexota bacterium]
MHTYRLDWESRTVRLSTTQGRKTLRFDIPAYASRYAGCPTDTADLLLCKGRWWLHVVVTVDAPEIVPTDAVMGVDLGVVRPAVTSTAKFLGERRWRELEARTFRLRRKLQAKGSRSAKRHLKRLSGKTLRRRRDHDHVLSTRIVQAAPVGGTMVLENLTNLRSRTKVKKSTRTSRRIHGWSFAQLKGFITYKAEERGLTVVGVDPRHTSQTCHACGHQARTNRRSQGDFWCRACGYRCNADWNGACNIAAKYLATRGTPSDGGQPVNLAIVSASSHLGSFPDASLRL